MPRTIRKYWGPLQGRGSFNYNWSAIDQDSTVFVTASEYNDQNKARFTSAATITISEIVPHGPPFDPNGNHGVTFIITVTNASEPINAVTDITVLDAKPVEVDLWLPPPPTNIGLRMQYQESKNWCWIAVGTSIGHFYNRNSTWTQCAVMTDIGHRINKYPANTSACPSADMIANNPDLAAALANPYNPVAEFILDDTRWGVDTRYLKTGWVGDPLTTVGHNGDNHGPDLGLSQIAAEINAGRPVVAAITWFDGPSHFVAIAGVLGDGMLALDPVNGESVVQFGVFPSTYYSGAKLDAWQFTKP